MPAAARPDVVRLSTLADIALTVPYLVGFHPTDSLVAVALMGPRERMTFSARLDLPDPDHDAEVAAYIAGAMERYGANAVLLFVYTDRGPGSADLPRRPLVDAVIDAVPMPVRDAVLVSAGRAWSYVCSDPRCCPPAGQPLDPQSAGATAMAAANALHGRAPLADRATLVASIAPIGGIAAVAADQALARAAGDRAAAGRDAYRRRARALFADLVERYDDPRATLDDDEAACLVLALHDVALRDEVMATVAAREEAGETSSLEPLLTAVARRALPPLDAPACTVLAWQGYASGDGALANAALDRVFAVDPDYSMARLLRTALDQAIPPASMRATFSDAMRQRVRRPRRRTRRR